MLEMVIFSSVNNTAHKICNASFFAPCGCTTPFSGCPPSILKVPINLCFCWYFEMNYCLGLIFLQIGFRCYCFVCCLGCYVAGCCRNCFGFETGRYCDYWFRPKHSDFETGCFCCLASLNLPHYCYHLNRLLNQ